MSWLPAEEGSPGCLDLSPAVPLHWKFNMTIRIFDELGASRAQTSPLSTLADAVIGIEAAYYLQRLLSTPPSKEPLLSALGGFPFALKSHIESELESMRSAGMTPIFVFGGLELGGRDPSLHDQTAATRANTQAWELYDQHQPVRAVETFGDSGSVKPESLFRFLQRILHAHQVDFIVAPYSACGQVRTIRSTWRPHV